MSLRGRLIAAGAAGSLLVAALLIAPHEGEVRQAYLDPVEVPTACFGQTGAAVRMGRTYSAEECAGMLVAGTRVAMADVARCIPVALPVGMQAALTSFAFNVGGRQLCRSTLARKAKAGDLMGACAELSRWTYAGGRQWPGLVRRRAHERAVCEGRAVV
ncbi:MAG: lysozyme [Chitinimonas sp.]|nr:lysozyme [Chitinimonas sp.]